MPPLKPLKRSDLIFYLKRCGFTGPYSGGKHQFMIKNSISLTIPNPHHSEIGREFLKRILQQANISVEEWEHL
ncbi:MAG: type II toxin-antitoxin system HicA family toxin [Bacteroidetes bacterium]|nr:type II toxin-antitoxin system HicA family toxin [Bacteroidota bacterium]